jgi:hypothetical protein
MLPRMRRGGKVVVSGSDGHPPTGRDGRNSHPVRATPRDEPSRGCQGDPPVIAFFHPTRVEPQPRGASNAPISKAAQVLGREGGRARAASMAPAERKQAAAAAVRSRWDHTLSPERQDWLRRWRWICGIYIKRSATDPTLVRVGSRGRDQGNSPVSNRDKECNNRYGPKTFYENRPWHLLAGVRLLDDVSLDVLLELEYQAHAAARLTADEAIRPTVRRAMAYRGDAAKIADAILSAVGHHGVIVREPEPESAGKPGTPNAVHAPGSCVPEAPV